MDDEVDTVSIGGDLEGQEGGGGGGGSINGDGDDDDESAVALVNPVAAGGEGDVYKPKVKCMLFIYLLF